MQVLQEFVYQIQHENKNWKPLHFSTRVLAERAPSAAIAASTRPRPNPALHTIIYLLQLEWW